MWKNYLKVAVRSLLRNRLYTLLSVLGLAVGLIGAITIALYTYKMLSYNHGYQNRDRIYLVESKIDYTTHEETYGPTGISVGPGMKEEIPEVEAFCRFEFVNSQQVTAGERSLSVDSVCRADSTLPSVLTCKVVAGDPRHLLVDTQSCVVNTELAQRLFGTTDVVGKTLTLNRTQFYRIGAVIENTPARNSLDFQLYLPLIQKIRAHQANGEPQYGTAQDLQQYFGDINFYTLIRLRPHTEISAVQTKMHILSDKYYGALFAIYHLKGSYLFVSLDQIATNSLSLRHYDPGYLRLLLLIGLFLLVIAGVNYVNLTTAQAAGRAREVGLRKVVGARREQLIGQFLLESVLISLVSLLLALGACELLMPTLSSLIGAKLSLWLGIPWWFFGVLLGITVLTGLLAGAYPAFYLSAFRPGTILKGEVTRGYRGRRIRQALVVFQFTLSAMMMIGTLTVFEQQRFMQSHSLGYDSHNLLEIYPPTDSLSLRQVPAFRDELAGMPAVKSVGTISSWSISPQSSRSFTLLQAGEPIDNSYYYYEMGPGAWETFGFRIVEGRGFESSDFDTYNRYFLINQAMARKLGWAQPIGKPIQYTGESASSTLSGEIIGVVADYNYASLQEPIKPLIYVPTRSCSNLIARLQPGMSTEVVTKVNHLWRQYFPSYPFSYSFVQADVQAQYAPENRLRRIFTTFSLLCILIACLGLFGLITYTARQKTKEIGIRRSLGASTGSIVLLLSREFGILVLVANLIAWPVAGWWAQHFLSRYAYRIALPYWTFFAALGVSLLIAGFTVVFKALQAAKSSPAHALRYE